MRNTIMHLQYEDAEQLTKSRKQYYCCNCSDLITIGAYYYRENNDRCECLRCYTKRKADIYELIVKEYREFLDEN